MSLLGDVLSAAVAFAFDVFGSGIGLPSGGDVNDPIEQQLKEIRARRRWLTALLWLFVPVASVFAYMTSELAGIEMAVVWSCFIVVVGIFVVRSRCPRCGHRFHRVGPAAVGRQSRLGWNPWVRSCGNCSLKLR